HIAVAGIAAGAAGGYAIVHATATLLAHVDLPGPAAAIGAAVVLMSAAVLASLMPAARAARVDVLRALRSEAEGHGMTDDSLRPRKPLRLWPGVVAAIIIVVMRYVVAVLVPNQFVNGMFAAIGGAAIVLLWWLLFSRAAWIERLGAIAVTVLAFYAI